MSTIHVVAPKLVVERVADIEGKDMADGYLTFLLEVDAPQMHAIELISDISSTFSGREAEFGLSGFVFSPSSRDLFRDYA